MILLLAILWLLVGSAQAQEALPSPQERPITLIEAIDLSLQHSLGPQLSKERIHQQEALVEQAMAALYPNFRFAANQANRTLNLAAQGFADFGLHLPIPVLVGPFYTFDARVQVVYNFLDAEARWRVKSRELGKERSELEDEVAHQQVITMVCLGYVTLLSALDNQQAVEADLTLAQQLLTLAQDRHKQGMVAGIDVTRSENGVMEQKLRWSSSQDRIDRAQLALARLVGEPLDSRYHLSDHLFSPQGLGITLEHAKAEGLEKRLDLRLAKKHEEQIQADLSGAESAMSPTMGVVADYGMSGNTPGANLYPTHAVVLNLNIPFWDGGLTDARVAELESQLKQAQLSTHDTEVQVEQDVRSSLLQLKLSSDQLETAQSSRRLAEKERTMAGDRFAHGLTDSLEVATAQSSLSRARDAEVQALAQYNIALVQLLATMGNPEAVYDLYKRTQEKP